jgi:hypothetical protein
VAEHAAAVPPSLVVGGCAFESLRPKERRVRIKTEIAVPMYLAQMCESFCLRAPLSAVPISTRAPSEALERAPRAFPRRQRDGHSDLISPGRLRELQASGVLPLPPPQLGSAPSAADRSAVDGRRARKAPPPPPSKARRGSAGSAARATLWPAAADRARHHTAAVAAPLPREGRAELLSPKPPRPPNTQPPPPAIPLLPPTAHKRACIGRHDAPRRQGRTYRRHARTRSREAVPTG